MLTRRTFITASLLSFATLFFKNGLTKMVNLKTLPKTDGFYFPAEWKRHEYTIMQFVPAQNWQHYGLKAARRDWATVANAVSEYEPVLMVIDPKDRNTAKSLLSREIELVEFPLNDGWARDTAPMFVVNDKGKRRAVNFHFNGWGKKFPPYNDDANLKSHLVHYLKLQTYHSALVSEGGAVTLDDEGTLITTEECLLNRNRNPNTTKSQVTQHLKDFLGVKKVIWLTRGLTPDPITDGHVDGICVFVDTATVMLHTTDDRNNPNYQICQHAKKILQQSSNANGRKLEIIELPLAWQVAHINFYIANGAVIVPIANNKREDARPMAILRETFSERKIIGVKGKILAKGGGGVHCITQQVPQI